MNIKICKRFLAIVSVGTMLVSGLSSVAEERTDEKPNDKATSVTMMVETPEEVEAQESETEEELVQFTYDEFIEKAIEIIHAVERFDKGMEEVESYIPDVYFCVSSESFKSIASQLINDRILSGKNYDSAFIAADDTFSFIAFYNNKILEKKTKDDELFDIGMFCTNQWQKELVHRADECFLDAYKQATKNCDSYEELINIVGIFKEKNYIGLYHYYSYILQYFYEHCLLSNYSQKELKQYYKSTKIFQMRLKDYYEMSKKLRQSGPENEIEEYIALYIEYDIGRKMEEWEDSYQQMITALLAETK